MYAEMKIRIKDDIRRAVGAEGIRDKGSWLENIGILGCRKVTRASRGGERVVQDELGR